MLKSEREGLKQQKRKPRVNYSKELATLYLFCLLKGKRYSGGAFISQFQTLERSFCTCESERKENDSQI